MYLIDDYSDPSVATYRLIVQRLKYFENCGDDFHTAALYIDLGNLLKNVRDPEAAIRAYDKADSLYCACDFDSIALFNKVNVAAAKVIARDTVGAVAILKQLAADSSVMAASPIANIVYSRLYQYNNDTIALRKLYESEGDAHDSYTLVYMTETAMRQADYDKALRFATLAVDRAYEQDEAHALAWALYSGAEALVHLSDSAQAFEWLQQAVELTDMIAVANEADEIKQIETIRELAVVKMKDQLARSRQLLKVVSIGAALLMLMLLALFVNKARIARLKQHRKIAIGERDAVSRKLVATQIAREESENLITNVSRRITDLSDSGEINGNNTRQIVNEIKAHSKLQADRDAFIESFAAMHPDFADKLRQINPAFSDIDIRLASYIVIGMDSKHIAATMGILPESVKQARWRLRTKLGLEHGKSLDEALRIIAAQ